MTSIIIFKSSVVLDKLTLDKRFVKKRINSSFLIYSLVNSEKGSIESLKFLLSLKTLIILDIESYSLDDIGS